MRFHPEPDLFENKPRFRYAVRTPRDDDGNPTRQPLIGSSRYDRQPPTGHYYVLFWYRGVNLAVHVPEFGDIVHGVLRRFPGVTLHDLELHRIPDREHARSADRRVIVRRNPSGHGCDLTVPGKRFARTRFAVKATSDSPREAALPPDDALRLARDLATFPAEPCEITVHPFEGGLRPLPQRITLSAPPEHCQRVLFTSGLRLFQLLEWEHVSFALVWD